MSRIRRSKRRSPFKVSRCQNVFRLAGLALMTGLAACTVPWPRGDEQQLFPEAPLPVDRTYQVDGRKIHYVTMPGSANARIVFIHGSPGDWKAWSHYMADADLQARATMISVDRPGFGESVAAGVMPNIERQARVLAPLLEFGSGPLILVGHSYGGAVAARLAMDHPDEVQELVLIAACMDPVTERPGLTDQVQSWSMTRQVLPANLTASNKEVMALSAELKKMEPQWKSLKMPVTVLQGDDDSIVRPANAVFASHQLPSSARIVHIPEHGHYFLWRAPGIVTGAILDALDEVSPQQRLR